LSADRADDEPALSEPPAIDDAPMENERRRIPDRSGDFAALDFRGRLSRKNLLEFDPARCLRDAFGIVGGECLNNAEFAQQATRFRRSERLRAVERDKAKTIRSGKNLRDFFV
jgi:hypothetical protein